LQADKAFCQHGSIMDASRSRGSGGGGGSEVIIVGVMRVDLDIAVRLGLRNHIESGSGGSSSGGGIGQRCEGNGSTPLTEFGGTSGVTGPKVLLGEEDVLLGGGGTGRDTNGVVGRGVGVTNGSGTFVGQPRNGGLMEYLIRWMFSW